MVDFCSSSSPFLQNRQEKDTVNVRTESEGARHSEFTSQLFIGVVWERQLPDLGISVTMGTCHWLR